MAEKIINGIDVSGCKYLNGNGACIAFSDNKCENHDCIYKEIERQKGKQNDK